MAMIAGIHGLIGGYDFYRIATVGTDLAEFGRLMGDASMVAPAMQVRISVMLALLGAILALIGGVMALMKKGKAWLLLGVATLLALVSYLTGWRVIGSLLGGLSSLVGNSPSLGNSRNAYPLFWGIAWLIAATCAFADTEDIRVSKTVARPKAKKQPSGFEIFLKQNAIWFVFVMEIAIFAYCNHKFLSLPNIVNISRQVSYYGIASIGMTFVILIAGIDLSIGSIIALVNVVCAHLIMYDGVNMWLAVLISIIMAIYIGILNGWMVASIGIPAIIATFASQTVFRGLAYLISGGLPIPGVVLENPTFGFFARWSLNKWGIPGDFGLIPICAIIMIICFAFGSFILNKSYFGRYFYAIGGNEEASELSGIRVNKMKYLIYALSGFFAGLAGIVLLSRSGSAQSTAAIGFEFEVITCVVLGGVSVSGGIGRMSGVIAGVLIIGSLKSGMIMMNVSEYVQMVVQGLVLATAVGIDCFSKKSQAS